MARRHGGKRMGESYADVLERKRQIAAAVNAAAKDESVKLQADVRCQRMLWMCVITLNDKHGFGPKRCVEFLHEVGAVVDEWEKLAEDGGRDYANEKLRQRAEQVTGMKIEHLYENQMKKAHELAERDGVKLDPMEI